MENDIIISVLLALNLSWLFAHGKVRNDIRRLEADRDNWRRQALAENANLEALKACLQNGGQG